MIDSDDPDGGRALQPSVGWLVATALLALPSVVLIILRLAIGA